jgi:hypothetical protein
MREQVEEALFATVAIVVVLFAAMLAPEIALALAVVFLVAIWLYTLFQISQGLPRAARRRR